METDVVADGHVPHCGMTDTGNGRRTRESYDAVAEEYAARLGAELAAKPLDRALLAALLEETAQPAQTAREGAGDTAVRPVADLGCGPGHVADWLAARTSHAAAAGVLALPDLARPALEDRPGRPRGGTGSDS